jgi:hypothetical protein
LQFAYRVRVVTTEQPEFSLSGAVDALVLERGRTANFKVTVDRGPGVKDGIELTLDGLPAGITVTSPAAPFVIAANQREVQLTLKAEADAKIAVAPIKLTGRTNVGDRELIAQTVFQPANPEQGRIAVPDYSGQLWLGVAVPTPFKFVGIFETKYISRGSVFVRKYHIDRNGFEGPLQVQLADRQGRHLQGVTASQVSVPAGESDFEFAVTLPPWMEIGRTCRSTLAVTGNTTDTDGTPHVVSYSSNDQNNQMIALVDPGRFAIQVSRSTLQAVPGQKAQVPIRIQRGPGLNNSVSVQVIASNALQGVKVETVEVAGDQNESKLKLDFAEKLLGLDVRPLTIRATTTDERGLKVTAESSLLLVP